MYSGEPKSSIEPAWRVSGSTTKARHGESLRLIPNE